MVKLPNSKWRFVVLSVLVVALMLALGKWKRVSAQEPTGYEFETVLANQCSPPDDLCAAGRFRGPVRDVLTTLSGQGWEVFAVSPVGDLPPGGGNNKVLFALRRPVSVP